MFKYTRNVDEFIGIIDKLVVLFLRTHKWLTAIEVGKNLAVSWFRVID